MKILKNISIIFLIAVFSFAEFGCGQYHDYDEVKDILKTNKTEFDKLAFNFLNQKACVSLIRRDFSKEKSFVPYSGGTYLMYFVTPLVDLKTYEIVIPKEFEGKEEKFWERNYKDIKGNNFDDLETFLNKYQIPRNFFDENKDFIRRNELYGFGKDSSFNYAVILFGPADGLIYQHESGITPKLRMAKEIKKIDDNWYYFREWD